ncbi:asparagine synthase (glutamine-hydrolyzing) [Reinekea blandensis]|uniref:asparagine synthase (glutamine-hydrolyzing) n=1 Tax=Reinekea blandensis MED297 TaxID=314283 RepID=A4B944_9GAMM|nr:asparagine synthase (glutamine-hydrolyzing) [Reinekea blandensis]EAR11145.1 asparagine synthase (glutamine-hydrolyzing) [Reinekea sp. MED297] [Reinekea blandensis MED297]
MCGINGLVSLNEEGFSDGSNLKQIVQEMNKELSHRGPDDSGCFESPDQKVVLGHRRLSIIDTSSAGHQPMTSSSGRYTIVYNGEIYNFQHLRAQVSFKDWNSGSDTEVLLQLIDEHGLESTLARLAGMFAFALFDSHENKLYLARDAAGEKPLYYGLMPNRFLFSSELTALEKASKDILRPSSKSAQRYFDYGYYPGVLTPYEDVYKLSPGALLCIDCTSGEMVEKSCAEFDHKAQKRPMPRINGVEFTKVVDHLESLLSDVIDDQKIADVELGCFLSGGIDSSLVTAVLSNRTDHPVESFTIGFNNPQFDESEKAGDIATHLGVNHNVIRIDEEDLLDCSQKVIEHLDEPFGNASAIPTYLLTEFVKKKVTVCMAGDGGDELFLGYNRYQKASQLRNLSKDVPAAAKKPVDIALGLVSHIPIDAMAGYISRHTSVRLGVNLNAKIRKLRLVNRSSSSEALYSALLSYSSDKCMTVLPPSDSLYGEGQFDFDQNFIKAASDWDTQYYLPGDCLYKTDRMAMANSLEVRVPLLDRRIVNFSKQIPVEVKLHEQQPKALLRALLKRYVPERLFDRPKMGFTVPISDWINGALSRDVYFYLNGKNLDAVGVLDQNAVSFMLKESKRGNAFYDNAIWSAYVFQKWMISRGLSFSELKKEIA